MSPLPAYKMEVLEQVRKENGGRLPVDPIIDAARDEDSPIHDDFVWDDSVAGPEYRRVQARQLVQRAQVTFLTNTRGQVVYRAYVSIAAERHDGLGYRHITDVLADEGLTNRAAADMAADLKRVLRKYSNFSSLQPWIDDVTAVVLKLLEVARGDIVPDLPTPIEGDSDDDPPDDDPSEDELDEDRPD